jgi:hypothetical protein
MLTDHFLGVAVFLWTSGVNSERIMHWRVKEETRFGLYIDQALQLISKRRHGWDCISVMNINGELARPDIEADVKGASLDLD